MRRTEDAECGTGEDAEREIVEDAAERETVNERSVRWLSSESVGRFQGS